jgi:signal transduction histidine kinase
MLLMLVPLLVAVGALGWLSYRTASESLTRDAIRAVGIEADAREQALTARLARQHERVSSFLQLARADCAAAGVLATCLRERLRDFLATEGAMAARLSGKGLEPLLIGPEAAQLKDPVALAPRQLARFEEEGQGRDYDIIAQQGELTLTVRFWGGHIEALFGERESLGRSGETFLADAHGVFITAPKYPGHSGESHSHPIDARPMRTCLSGQSGEMLAPDYRDVPIIHGFRFIEEIGGGCIMAHIDQAEAFAPARALRARMLQTAAVLVTGAVVLSILFARRLSRPVWRLTDRARALQAGDFDTPVPSGGPRELRTFSETFAAMARSLQDSTRALQGERTRLDVLATLSRLLAESSLDVRAVLEVACRHVAERIGDVCQVLLVSADGQWLETAGVHAREAAVEGLSRDLLKTHPQRVTEGVSARVLATGEPLFMPTLEAELLTQVPASYREAVERLAPRGFALLPLKTSGRVIGVLSLVRLRRETPYSEEDLAFFQEVAGRVALAIENARLYQQAREAVRSREDVVAIVSHDLRTPLNAITLSTQAMLKHEPLEEWQRKGLSRITSAAGRAQRMIHDLLDFTQARVGGIPVRPSPCELHVLVRHVVDEVRLAHPERRIDLEVQGDSQGEWDCDRMAQVLSNLVGNAVQHSPADAPVRISLRAEGEELVLDVHNGGAPIAPEVLPTLFEPFRRGQGSGARSGSVGLGLYITREIVHAHGGGLTVRSTPEHGTTFTVRVPRRPSAGA